jgi:hypothetical protein
MKHPSLAPSPMSFGQATPRQGEGWGGVVQGVSAIFSIMRIAVLQADTVGTWISFYISKKIIYPQQCALTIS